MLWCYVSSSIVFKGLRFGDSVEKLFYHYPYKSVGLLSDTTCYYGIMVRADSIA